MSDWTMLRNGDSDPAMGSWEEWVHEPSGYLVAGGQGRWTAYTSRGGYLMGRSGTRVSTYRSRESAMARVERTVEAGT